MFPQSAKHRADYYQGLADSLGLPLNGQLSAKAKAVRAKPNLNERPAPKIVPKVVQPDILSRPLSTAFDWGICVHEAGHAVGALACGAWVDFASVGRDGIGETWHARASDVAADAVVIYCGPLAETLLCPGADPFSRKSITEPDGDMFRLVELGLSSAALATARARAVNIVCEHRTAIGKIANVLAARGFIDGKEASQLFNASR